MLKITMTYKMKNSSRNKKEINNTNNNNNYLKRRNKLKNLVVQYQLLQLQYFLSQKIIQQQCYKI
jgi:hypothetical protein